MVSMVKLNGVDITDSDGGGFCLPHETRDLGSDLSNKKGTSVTPVSNIWPTLSSTDYPFAAVRLTTLLHERVSYLLFGYVELFPAEIPRPEEYVERQNFPGDMTVLTSLSVMHLSDALRWYEQAASGNLVVPKSEKHLPVQAVRLGSEPALGNLVAAKEPPVEVFWHNASRMCRLVPMETLPPSVDMFLKQPEETSRQNRVRDWLKDHCFVDLLAYPDCAGSIILLAPNPVIRSWNYGPSRTLDNDNEVIKFRAIPRKCCDFTGLTIRLHESRLDGRFFITPVCVDTFGEGEIIAPHNISELALEVICAERGLLAMTNPTGYFKSISFESHIVGANVKVEIPARTKGAPSTSATVAMIETGFTTQVGKPDVPNGASRLAHLLAARSAPAADSEDEQLFVDNRSDAVMFVRRLIGVAKHQVVFVDSYFNFIDLREFALFVSSNRCAISVLTGRDEPKWQKEILLEDPPQTHGKQMLANIEHINKIRAENGFPTVEVKVMGASSRKYHDRFLVIDAAVWHFGHSFNALGDGSVAAATRLRKPERVFDLIIEDMQRAETFENYWKAVLAATEGANQS